jgi:hypothetical protein
MNQIEQLADALRLLGRDQAEHFGLSIKTWEQMSKDQPWTQGSWRDDARSLIVSLVGEAAVKLLESDEGLLIVQRRTPQRHKGTYAHWRR